MKTIYLIKHAKSKWSSPDESDVERELSKKGYKDIKSIGNYLSLRGISPDMILSSCALRAQETTNILAQKLEYFGPKLYLEELYLSSSETVKEIIMAQDREVSSLFVVGHNPYITELANIISSEHIAKIPALGIVAIDIDIDEWSELEEKSGKIDFFIFPKQFKYYMPKQIRATLSSK